jgi:phage baseplate assembly protein W
MVSKVYSNKVIAKGKVITAYNDKTEFRYRGFSSTEYKKNFKLYDIEAVKQDIINHFNIRKGEKLENPTFGTEIYDLLYEQMTPEVKEKIGKEVQTVLNFDRRIKVERLSIDSTMFGIAVIADVTFLPYNLVDQIRLEFDRNTNII